MPNLLSVWPKLNQTDICRINFIAKWRLFILPSNTDIIKEHTEVLFADRERFLPWLSNYPDTIDKLK